jgi:hypothetical protein
MTTDTDVTIDTAAEPTERLSLPSLDSFAAVNNLIALAIDPKAVRRHLRSLHDSLAAIDRERRGLEADRQAFAADKAKQLAEIAAEREVVTRRLLAAQETERANEERHAVIRKLEVAWSGLRLPGEPADGFGTLARSRPFSGLQVARHAAEHGRLPDHPDAPLPQEDPVRTGFDGTEFSKHTTITRTPEPPAGARVRPGRKGAATPAA